MHPLTLQSPVSQDCLCHNGLQHPTLSRRHLKTMRLTQRTVPLLRRVSAAARWKDFINPAQVAVKALEQAEETSWREKDDTAYVAEQQAVTRSRWQNFFTTRYDKEIFAVLFPALLAIFLDPVMILIDTGI